MVRRHHNHYGLWKEMIQIYGSQTNGWSCVSSHGFGDKLDLFGERAQGLEVKPYVLSFVFGCYNPDIFRRDKAIDSFDRLPQKRILPNNLKHLLRIGLTA